MKRAIYIWQQEKWPHFQWDAERLITLLAEVRYLQGQLTGRMTMMGFDGLKLQLDAMTQEIVGSSSIEGLLLNADSVRSSLARHLGMDALGDIVPDHYSEGVVNVMIQATTKSNQELTPEILFGWHSALFPTGYSNGMKINVASWREGESPMQVVSGPMGRERVHYEAPSSSLVPAMMEDFLGWINDKDDTDSLIRAGLAHLWFVTIHPFDDGNGRMTRTITEMMLARADEMPQRFYSLSAEIMHQRKQYYEALEKAQKGNMDVTDWLIWFLSALKSSIETALSTTETTIRKTKFWAGLDSASINERQRKILNMLWDGFEGKLTSQKWAKINHCSQDTASRDISALIALGVLRKAKEGGRNTNYTLVW